MCKINCSGGCRDCAPDEWTVEALSKELTQTQQELFLTKGSLMVRDKQLEETDNLLQKAIQQNIELQTELEMLHDVLETASDIHEKAEKQIQYLQTTLDHMND